MGNLEGWTEVGIPGRIRRGPSMYKPILEEFIASDLECVRKDYGEDVHKVYGSLRFFATKDDLPVKVVMRGTNIYLVRTDK